MGYMNGGINDMIGQKLLLNQADIWIKNEAFPRFLIISGDALSGRYTFVKQLKYKLQAYMIECDLGVESVREAIKNCYRCAGTTIYLFRNADRMSTAAKNALLKITEEPPRQAYFIMTVQNSDNVLETLRSRAVNLSMSAYSDSELDEYFSSLPDASDLVRKYSDTPGMMQALQNYCYSELIDFCETIIENIKKVSGVNAFKIVNKIKIKEDSEGYDPNLFFAVLKSMLFQKAVDSFSDISKCKLYSRMLQVTSKYQKEFFVSGVKKDSTLDMWILSMREC